MDNFQIFILCLFGIFTLNTMHLRHTRRSIIRDLEVEGKSASEIATIMKAYKD